MHTLPAPHLPAPLPFWSQRRLAAAGLLLSVLALHLALLRNARAPGSSHGGTATAAPVRSATVLVAAQPSAHPGHTPLLAGTSATAGPLHRPPTRPPAQPVVRPARDASPPAGAVGQPPPPDTAAAAEPPGPAADASQVPTYRTLPPPAATLAYTLQRGQRAVPARLQWAPDGTRYTLSLATDDDADAAELGSPLRGLGASSRGSFDSAGLAPERYVDRRRGRDRGAANFQRDSGQLRLGASAQAEALQPGMQDRVSWMLQLAAVLQANPTLALPGAHVVLWVAATRGAPQVWDFEVLAADSHGSGSSDGSDGTDRPESTAASGQADQRKPGDPAQPPALLHLQRRAQRSHALQVDAWLDPARHHLPWRVRLSAPPSDWVSDLRLAPP